MEEYNLQDPILYTLKDVFSIILGSLIIAFGLHFVIVPAHILTGGINGLSIIIYFLTGQPLWLWIIILNIPLFLAGYWFINRKFMVFSLFGTLLVSLFLAAFQGIDYCLPVNDILLSALLGGTINGLGLGIVLRGRGSTGGLDIIAAIIHRYWGINLGTTFLACNLLVLAASLLANSFQLALYSAVLMFMTSKVVDAVTAGIDTKKTVMIVSHNSEEIAQAILHNLHRGCTFITGRGAYSGKNEDIIIATTGKTQIPYLKNIVFTVDPHAFVTITDTVEVYGKGFKSSIQD